MFESLDLSHLDLFTNFVDKNRLYDRQLKIVKEKQNKTPTNTNQKLHLHKHKQIQYIVQENTMALMPDFTNTSFQSWFWKDYIG